MTIGSTARRILNDLEQSRKERLRNWDDKIRPEMKIVARNLLPEIERRILDAADAGQNYIIHRDDSHIDGYCHILMDELRLLLEAEECKVEHDRGDRFKISWK